MRPKAIILVLIWGVATGCDRNPGGETTCDPPCGLGEECVDGQCVPIECDPPCGSDEECVGGQCVPKECDPPCEAGEHCEAGQCEVNVCDPPCQAGEICLTHDGTECYCPDPPCGEPTPCNDGLDNDGDGWIDALDPDCAVSDEEVGFGTTGCNDGLDNDGDGGIDATDLECASGADDEVLGDGPCADACLAGAQDQGRTCQLWDSMAMSWIDEVADGVGHLHNRARNYTVWLRERLMPVGGVMRGYFTDATYDQVYLYGGTRDSPIWTGIYLAAEALRLQATGAPDAAAQLEETVRVLDRRWRISGDQGYLARYAAPTSSPQPVLDIFAAADPENHRDVAFEGDTWHWKGNVSRDQYQGAMLGYSFAYETTSDETLREIIRDRVVSFIEKLMVFESRQVNVVINGIPLATQMELGHCVYTDDETPDGLPRLTIEVSPFDFQDDGFLTFWPNPSEFLRQLPGLGGLPDIYLRSQAIQLGSMFQVALQVSDGVPDYATRRQAIAQHYETYAEEWLDLAADWSNTNQCGDSYHGLNIAFVPAWNWARLETDPARRARLQTEVLRDAMWSEVWDHKNVFFAYIYASQASPADDVTTVIADHSDQLRLFPPPPNTAPPVDNTAEYSEDPSCPGLSQVAIDVDDRVPSTFMWERNPWKLQDPGTPNTLYSGVDYLIAYWMGRSYGFLTDDSAGICLQWRD